MKPTLETALAIRKDTILAKFRRVFFGMIFFEDFKILKLVEKIQTPKKINIKNIVIPRGIGKIN